MARKPDSLRLRLVLDVEMDEHRSSPEDLLRQLEEAVAERVRDGVFGAADLVEDWRIETRLPKGPDPLRRLAKEESWFEHVVVEAIEDWGLRDPDEILRHFHSASSDLDWKDAREDVLESLIRDARAHLGNRPFPSDDDTKRAIIADLVKRHAPEEDEPDDVPC